MASLMSKYALIKGREAKLIREIPHALSSDSVCVFGYIRGGSAQGDGYVTKQEWEAAAKGFAAYAANKHMVTSESSTKDKVSLFKSLFKGRDDVYAHGFSRKQGGIGYVPVCFNERTRNCPRWTRSNPKIKCAECPSREFVPVNDQAIIRHFKGERDDFSDVMGLYVLRPDCKTWVLVADFDKEGWQQESLVYRDACRHFGLSPAVERSRSGNGAHVWLFFDEPLEASLARDLGCTLITHAMSQQGKLKFEAYDRLFPTQSTIPDGGFGNLIALPLQGRAQRKSNSVFVDDHFEAYPDQWMFLSSITRATLHQVKEVLGSTLGSPLGQLASDDAVRGVSDSFASGTLGMLPFGTDSSLAREFPPTLKVVKANMLFVSKGGLSAKAQNRIRRLAAFPNPEFYRAQAMHQSVYGKPRIIWCGEETDEHIALPRACEQKLIDVTTNAECKCVLEDKRSEDEPIVVTFNGTLRAGQQQAADTLLRYECGVLSAPTGFGKTVIGAYLINALKVRTLVIVPKANLIDQWKTRLEQFLTIQDNRAPLLTKTGKVSKRQRPVVGQIGGGKNKPSGIIDIATFQSLTAKDDIGALRVKEIVANYSLVICDECHYAAAPNLEFVMKHVKARHVYGLSATPKRADGLQGIIFMQLGPIRYKVDPKEQACEQGFKRLLVPRFTRIRLVSLEAGASFNQVVDALCGHASRNALIVEDVVAAVRAKRLPLVITKRKEHALALGLLLKAAGIKTFVLTGDGTTKEKRLKLEQVRAAGVSDFALVATGSYVGEGFDLPALDTLMLASPYSWEGVITQYSGRLHRESEGKCDVMVYDYVDTSVAMLERMYKKRLRTYAKLGYEVKSTGAAREPDAAIMTSSNWQDCLRNDLDSANKSIIISAPYLNPKLVQALSKHFADALARGVKVDIVLRKAKSQKSAALQDEAVARLASVGCTVATFDSGLSGIAIIDGKISWYGTLPLFAFAKPDDCSLRVVNAEIAAELEKALGNSA